MEHPLVKKATSLALLRIGIVLLASSPHGVDCSLARRRHPSVAGYSPSLEASELTREESSIPGVSIWTSKNAAASLSSVCSNSGSEAASTSAPAYVSNDNSGERRRGGTAVFDSSSWDAEAAYQGVNGNGYKGADWLAGCQVRCFELILLILLLCRYQTRDNVGMGFSPSNCKWLLGRVAIYHTKYGL